MRPEEVISACMRRLLRRRNGDATDAQIAQTDRAAALGGLGEALVAGALRELNWPMLRNVVLLERNSSAELDFLVQTPTSIAVLEVKTWSGFIAGSANAAEWLRYGAGNRVAPVTNAVRQNIAHVGMVERAIGDRETKVFGLVVSAGHARYAESLRRHVVPMTRLLDVLRAESATLSPSARPALDRAWDPLAAEASRSPARREAHTGWVRSRRNQPSNCE